MTRKRTTLSRNPKTPKKGTRRKTIANKRRKGLLSILIPWIKRIAKRATVLIFLLWVGAWIWFSNSLPRSASWAHTQLIEKSATLGFTLENVLVEGRIHSDDKMLLSHLDIKTGDPLLSFNPKKAHKKIQNMPWIRSVTLQRRLPKTLHVHLEEHIPIGLIQRNGKVHILDELGAIIPDPNITPFRELPLFRGKNAQHHAPNLTALLLATPDLHKRVKSAVRISDRRWDLTLKNDIEIRLPEHDVGLSLKRLSDAHAANDLLNHNIISIDLRDPERMTVRTKPGKVQDYDINAKSSPAI